MTTFVPANLISPRFIKVVVIPRGRRMSWHAVAKYNQPGKQEGLI